MNCSCTNGGEGERRTAAQENIAKIIGKFQGRQGTLIPILQEVQEYLGYLPRWALNFIAQQTGIRPAKVYGVVTFYTQFNLEPKGRYLIMICQGTACHVNGSARILEALEDELGIAEGETTADGNFTLETVACLGCCSLAPVITINGNTYGKLTPAKARKIISQYRSRIRESKAECI
ncbi:MAG: NADH-quinone oxidoreductase subunit NuoE [Firmicutes bacterium]|nr:NADH-quinone oxidoreductase subunit NuoE [Bacillota bacterium]